MFMELKINLPVQDFMF